MFGDPGREEGEARTLLPDPAAKLPDLASVEADIEMADVPDHGGYADLPILRDQLGGTLGTGFRVLPAELQ